MDTKLRHSILIIDPKTDNHWRLDTEYPHLAQARKEAKIFSDVGFLISIDKIVRKTETVRTVVHSTVKERA